MKLPKMKHSRNLTIFLAFVCACLAHHVNSRPQAGRSWPQLRPNATAYGNRWQQKFETTRVPTQNQQPNWQSNGGWNWLGANNSPSQQQGQRSNQTIGNQNNYNTNIPNNNWQQRNGTRPSVGGIYQPEGERPWLNNNYDQSHPNIQVPGFGNRPHFVPTKQPNRSNSFGAGSTVGWRAPQSHGNYPQANYWESVRNNSTQNVPTTRQPIRNNGWQASPSAVGNWNNVRPIYNSTSGGQNFGPNWHLPSSTPPPTSGWVAPLNPTSNANWNGAAGNSTSGSGVNSHPVWNPRIPGSTLVTGNNNQNAFFGNERAPLAPYNPGSSYSGTVPVSNGGQLPHGSSSSGTPLAPLAGGAAWSSNPSQAGLSQSIGQQQPQARPIGNSNPYANLFN